MPKFKQGKKLIISLLCIVLVALCAFACLSVFASINEKVKLQGADGYDFKNGGFLNNYKDGPNEQYKANSVFYVSTYQGLLAFSETVSYGYNFKDKTVCLLNDIYSDGTNWRPIGASMSGTRYNGESAFSGKFNGNSYTLYNFKCEVTESGTGSGEDFQKLGIFSFADNAIIENIRVKQFTIKNYNTNYDGFYMSGLVAEAHNYTQISNCIVEDFELEANSKAHKDYFGGIVCAASINVDNSTSPLTVSVVDCMVNNINITPDDPKESFFSLVGPSVGDINPSLVEEGAYYTRSEAEKAQNQYCDKYSYSLATRIIEEPRTNAMGNTYKAYVLYIGIGGYYAENIIVRKCDTTKYALHDGSLSFESVYVWTEENDETSTEFLESNGTIRESVCEFFYVPNTKEFNNGCPYLKSYVSLIEYYFETSDDQAGSVKIKRFKVPTSLSLNFSLIATEQVCYGYTVKAIPKAGYEFKGWTLSESGETYKKYTANFELIEFSVTNNVITLEHDCETYTLDPVLSTNIWAGKATLIDELRIYYNCVNVDNNIIRFGWGPSGQNKWNANYYLDTNENRTIWYMYVIDEIFINNISLTKIENFETKVFTIDEILETTGLSVEDITTNGIIIDITFKLKTYGVEVG